MILRHPAVSARARLTRLAVAGIRSGFAALDRLCLPASALCAETLFRFPPPSRPTPRERLLLAGGARSSVRIRGGRLATWRWGQGPPVLLVHGWGGHAGRLAEFAEPVASSGFSVIAFDAPGHGASSGRLGTIFELLDSIRTLDERFGPFAGVVGHSLGASAALLAARRGVAFDRAILLAPPADLEAYLPRFARRFGIPTPTWKRMKARLEARYAIRWERLRLSNPAEGARPSVLVFHDVRDARVPLREGLSISRGWPGARLVRTRGLGHHRILRSRAVILRAVQFLRGAFPAASAEARAC